ncbi:5463_t:CDS:2, partial [Entrophospora sp. SA101]
MTDVKICPQKGDWGITYDDGPSPFTPTILDYLGSKGLKATFFVIGSRATNHPDVLLRASKEVIIAELKWTEKIIKEITGLTPKYMRPPRGDYDDRVRNIAKQLGYKSVIWDHDTFDWMSQQDPTYDLNWIPANFTQWVNEASTTGHVSLEHDLYQQTVGKAPKAIDI